MPHTWGRSRREARVLQVWDLPCYREALHPGVIHRNVRGGSRVLARTVMDYHDQYLTIVVPPLSQCSLPYSSTGPSPVPAAPPQKSCFARVALRAICLQELPVPATGVWTELWA